MNLLAIETSTDVASIAVCTGEQIFSEEQDSPRTHAQLVLPLIDSLMQRANLRMHQLDGIIFGCGPGSFTGLRIACSIAKGLAFAHDLPLTPVSSLAAIAWSVRQQKDLDHRSVLAVLDARMNEMYWGYSLEGQCLVEPCLSSVQEIQVPNGKPCILAGVGIDLYWNEFSQQIQSQVKAKIELFPKAAAMIQLALHARIEPVAVADAQPLYIRNQVTHGDNRG